MLLFDLDPDIPQAIKAESFRYYRGDYTKMREEMATVDWEQELDNCNTDQAWEIFERKITESMERNIPKAAPQPKRERWLTKEAEKAVRQKQRLHNRHRKHRTNDTLEDYRKARNEATRICREARSEYEKGVCRNYKDNPKEFWGYVSNQTEGRCNVAPLRREDGSLAVTSQEKASVLSAAFASVFCQERTDTVPTLPAPDHEILETIGIDETEIIEEIKKTKKGKSAGPDSIHPCIIRELCLQVCKPLKIIFDKSLEEGKVPSRWKEAIVVPIFKKGSRHDAGNYRPVSLTSVCGKVLERIVRRKVLHHLDRLNYFCNEQYGFRPHRSCSSQLLTIVEEWTDWLDNRTDFDCIYLDYRKAFDSVPHLRLLEKVKSSGVGGRVHKWIESFLSQRSQSVRVEEELSEKVQVTSGIPQGSVLGPTLFLIYVNELPTVIKSRCAMFADDTKIYAPVGPDNEEVLQEDLNSLQGWSDKWQLPFNAKKCKVMHFGKSNRKNPYTLDERTIDAAEEEKDLGVTFDPSLNFARHFDAAISKANSRLGIIKRSFKFMDGKSFVMLYKSLIRPILEYCSVVTKPLRKQEADRIESIQRRATKLVTEVRELPYEERLRSLNLPSLSFRRERADMIQVYRILERVDDLPVEKFFELADNSDHASTRTNGKKIVKARCRTKLRAHTFSQRVVNKWNSLPANVVMSPTVNGFKNSLGKSWQDRTTQAEQPA
jgi:hypothetical protein